MSAAGERARLFVALELPGEVRDRLALWRDEVVAGVPGLRPVAVENLHVIDAQTVAYGYGRTVWINRLDGHMNLANSLALRAAHITRDTKDVAGGTIVRDAAGEPTGVLKDNAMDLMTAVPDPSVEMSLRALDLCTGSGCVAITIARERPTALGRRPWLSSASISACARAA